MSERIIHDAAGRAWSVLPGRESYGMQVLLFVAEDGGEVRKAMLAAQTQLDAWRELDGYSDDILRDRLAASVDWAETLTW